MAGAAIVEHWAGVFPGASYKPPGPSERVPSRVTGLIGGTCGGLCLSVGLIGALWAFAGDAFPTARPAELTHAAIVAQLFDEL